MHTARIAGRRRLVAQASAGRPPLILNDPRALAALGALPARFDRESATAAWRAADLSEGESGGLWDALLGAGLLADEAGGGGAWWDELGWREARTYHESTRDYPFLQMDEREAFSLDAGRMEGYRQEGRAPDPYPASGPASRRPRPPR